MGDIILFIPRPNHNRETDFPAIPFILPSSHDLVSFAKQGAPPDDDRACSEINPQDIA